MLQHMQQGYSLIEVIFNAQDQPLDYRFLEVNSIFEAQTGLVDAVGKTMRQLRPAHEQHWFELYGQVAKTGQSVHVEQHAAYLAGGVWYEVFAFPFGEVQNHQVAILFNDITERKQRQIGRELLISITQDLGQLTDETQIIRSVGARLAAHLGITGYHYVDIDEDRDQATVRHCWHALDVPPILGTYPLHAFVSPAALANWRAGKPIIFRDIEREVPDGTAEAAVLKAGAAAQQISACITIGLSQEGKWKACFAVADSRPRQWTAGEIELVEEVAGQLLPRIERARAEAALLTSQKRFESIANLVPDLLWDSNPDGSTNWYNQRWLEYTGQRFEEAIGWGWTDAIHPDDQAASARRYSQAVEAGTLLRQEHRIRHHDGTYRWFVVKAAPLKDETGQVVKMYGAAIDIHGLKRLEATLREADRRKDEFIAMLGHELRNPLASISNMLLLLQLTQGADSSLPYPKAVDQMSREVGHLNRMVDDLLEVGRIRYGLIQLHKKPFDLVPLVRQTVELTRYAYAEQQRHLFFASPVTSLMVLGDETRLVQVVMNLLTNGLKYTHKGGRVWVSLQRVSDSSLAPQALLSVKDDGIGIAPEQQQAIFDIFVQGETPLDRPQGGLGLGLAVVKQLVNLREGQVAVQSGGEGQGSEFLIHLPLTAQAAVEPEVDLFMVPAAGLQGRVLVVDDNVTIAHSTVRLLKLMGYEARARYSGSSALEEAQQWAPDVVLLDLGMPQMDGFELNRRLKEQSWGQTMAVIALTGYGQQAHQLQVKQAGFSGYLLKPLQLAQLSELLNEVMGR
ncbi:ATP-binding protein [Spirosoma liriopis]|nr:ATP-binding protein [Spirosoma liriopis]